MSDRIHIGRILGAVTLTVVTAGAFAATWGLGAGFGAAKEKARALAPALRLDAWPGGARHWSALDRVAVWGVTETEAGNAFAAFWPDDGNVDGPCQGMIPPVAFNSPAWSQRDGQWQRSAACERVDAVVAAAHLADLDFADWMARASTAEMYGDRQIDLYRRPWKEMSAVLARSHARILEDDLPGAESDARAVVSAGLQLTRNAPHAIGMTWGLQLMIGGLDHLRVIRERMGDGTAVASLDEAMVTAIETRAALREFMQSAIRVAEVPDGWDPMARFAADPAWPLGMRTYATFVLGFGWLGQQNEVLFGPNEARREAVESLRSRPELHLAVARAKEGLAMPLTERIRLIRTEM